MIPATRSLRSASLPCKRFCAGGPANLTATRGGRLLAWAEAETGTPRSSQPGADRIMRILKPAGLRVWSRSCGSRCSGRLQRIESNPPEGDRYDSWCVATARSPSISAARMSEMMNRLGQPKSRITNAMAHSHEKGTSSSK